MFTFQREKPPGIRCDQHVGRGVHALALESLEQGVRLSGDQIDLGAGPLRKSVQQGFDQLFLAGRIEIDLVIRQGGGGEGH